VLLQQTTAENLTKFYISRAPFNVSQSAKFQLNLLKQTTATAVSGLSG